MTFIIVKTQFEYVHYYKNAPEAVSYLRHPHRHVFYVEAEIEVFDDDRELEFIIVKRDLNCYLNSFIVGPDSCEMLAKAIQQYLKKRWPAPKSLNRDRIVNVKVFEDNENGAYIKEA